MRYMISAAIFLAIGSGLWIRTSGAQDVPALRVCSAKEPMTLDQEIDRLSASRLTAQALSLRALGGQQKASIDDFMAHVQQGLFSQYRWPVGSTLTVAFLSGDPVIQQRIQSSALVWTKYANIKLNFGADPATAMIRIGVDLNGKSESTIGNQALKVPQGTETMHFGWLTKASSQAEYDSVVLHEFGHVLGNVHEHQLPESGISWNRSVVYQYCATNWHWTKDDVDHNIFEKYTPEQLIFTRLDPQSIMMYSFPKEWTTDGFSTPWNYKLSDEDAKFVARFYPMSAH